MLCIKLDQSARAQIVHRTSYPEFHKILQCFKIRTGRGVLLNTSFNLHGLPIVTEIDDALYVLRNTDLRHLIVGNILISKKES